MIKVQPQVVSPTYNEAFAKEARKHQKTKEDTQRGRQERAFWFFSLLSFSEQAQETLDYAKETATTKFIEASEGLKTLRTDLCKGFLEYFALQKQVAKITKGTRLVPEPVETETTP